MASVSSSFSFFKKDPSKPATTSSVVVRKLQGPVPAALRPKPPPLPAVVVRPSAPKRKRADTLSDARPLVKATKRVKAQGASRGSSADSATPPPVRDAARAGSASMRGSNPSSRAGSVAPLRRAKQLPPLARECAVKPEEEGAMDGVLSCATVYSDKLVGYDTYFLNPADPSDNAFALADGKYPTVTLELPARGAADPYVLATPKDKDNYDPIKDLEETLYVIVEHYIPPAHRALFGPMPTKFPSLAADDDAPSPPSASSTPLLRLFKRAITRRDGPAFLSTLSSINETLRSLKAETPNALTAHAGTWTPTGMPAPLAQRIVEETYQRVARPRTADLRRYTPFSDRVYGELLPAFVSRLLRTHTRLAPGQLFVDLGSGVGQVCVQAALETGCEAYGIEKEAGPAAVAREMAPHAAGRARGGWGVRIGAVELEEGDMLESARASERIAKADVVLINNKAFTAELNDALRTRLLDLKEGARIISLRPFVPASGSGRSLDDPAAILDVAPFEFFSGEVSWTGQGGEYFVHTVDRAKYAERLARVERERGGRRRR